MTRSGLLERATGFFASRGIQVERVLTDNGGDYLSRDFLSRDLPLTRLPCPLRRQEPAQRFEELHLAARLGVDGLLFVGLVDGQPETFYCRPMHARSLPPRPLSRREAQVMQLMKEGMTNRQIAGRLCVSVHAVKFHLASIYRKFEVHNRTEAVVAFLEANGALRPPH